MEISHYRFKVRQEAPSRVNHAPSSPLQKIYQKGVRHQYLPSVLHLHNEKSYPRRHRHAADGWYDEIRGSCHGILCIQLEGFCGTLPFGNLQDCPLWKFQGVTHSTYSSFGYDHSTDSYKVIACSCIKRDNGVYEVKTFVHTMGTNFWRRIQADFPSIYDNQLGQFVCGTLNWLPYRHSSIVSLDLENESYRQLLLPVLTSSSKSLCVVKECLCILVHMGLHSDVWLMKDYGNKDSWTKLFRVPVPNMRGVGLFPYLKALYVYEDDQVLLKLKSKLVVYNSTDGTFKTLKIPMQHFNSMIPAVYQESLISPCS